ncbi:Protease I [Paraburkholderia tropica]|uniref:type 1 glutamine amidotransferase domain-containing protein n=1 Tax=Paraburkholderia tropica TaxID=92647 RepID=UPI001CAEA794|nr:type 1 glutamine amidotransferase domain-containing protein [Paraburkholderia tropica]CAG9203515.1 Protease I [Paraburkholderia tropica]
MTCELEHCKVAILAVDGFEEVELTGPQQALIEAGAHVDVISSEPGEIQGFRHVDKGARVKVDRTFAQAKPDDYDAVVLPGGVINGDAIRLIPEAQAFVKSANAAHKPIAAICHGGWLPVSAGIVKGRTMTSWPSLQDDIRNAGGTWVDQRVVRDGNFVTSRKPDDLPAFNAELIACLTAAPKSGHAPRQSSTAHRWPKSIRIPI